MDHHTFRAIRRRARLTQSQLADLFGLAGSGTIRRYEADPQLKMARAVTPPVAILMRQIEAGDIDLIKEASERERASKD